MHICSTMPVGGLIALFVIGYALKFIPGFPKTTYQQINKLIIYGPLPALTLSIIPKLEFTPSIIYPVASAWFIFLMAIPFFYLMKKWLNWTNETFAALVMVCGLGNTSFIGFPVIEMLFDKEALRYAILVDQSTFVILSTVAIIWASAFSHAKVNWKNMVKKLLLFPPFIALIVALVVQQDTLSFAQPFLSFLGSCLVPMAIFSIGMQFEIKVNNINYRAFGLGLLYKLVLMPAIIYIIFFILLKQNELIYQVTLIECAMPPMITASIIANQNRLEGQLSNALVTYGIPISFMTIAFWHFVIR